MFKIFKKIRLILLFFLVFGIIAFGVTCSRCSKEIKDVKAEEDKIIVHFVNPEGRVKYYEVKDGITWAEYDWDLAEDKSFYVTYDSEGYLKLFETRMTDAFGNELHKDDRVKPGYYGLMDSKIFDLAYFNIGYGVHSVDYFSGMTWQDVLDLYEYYSLVGFKNAQVSCKFLNDLVNIKYLDGQKRIYINDKLIENTLDSSFANEIILSEV